MRRRAIRETLDALEDFMLVKRQNLIIYAWIELKKRDKRLVRVQSSRTRSILGGLTSHKSCDISPRAHWYQHRHILPSNLSSNSPHKDKYNGLNAYHIRNTQQANLSMNRSQGYRSPRQKDEISRRSIFGISNQGLEIDENDDFEEIVIERLAKLEQNISKMMQDKKMKECSQVDMSCTHIARHKYRNDETTVNAQGRLIHRRKDFLGYLSDHQKTPKDSIHNLRDTICNLKYIPAAKHNNQHLRMIHKPSKQQDNIIDNIGYFCDGNIKRKIGSPARKTYLYEQGYQHRSSNANIRNSSKSIGIQASIKPRNRHFLRTEPDLLFSPIKIKQESMKSLPKPNNSSKPYSNSPKISYAH